MNPTQTELIKSINSKLNMKLVDTKSEDINCCKDLIATDEEIANGVSIDKVPTLRQLQLMQQQNNPISIEDFSRMFESNFLDNKNAI